jgi:hypothetical protein
MLNVTFISKDEGHEGAVNTKTEAAYMEVREPLV